MQLFRIDQATGYFPFQACRADRRFSYGVYVPPGYTREGAAAFRILVAVHGSERAPEVVRELFAEFAQEARCIVLVPLFPVAVTDDEEVHNYIFLKYRDIRFDRVLLAMVDEVAERFCVPAGKLWLAGFSGVYVDAHGYEAFFNSTALLGAPVLLLVWLASRILPVAHGTHAPEATATHE